MMNSRYVAQKMGGDAVGAAQVLCPGPGHSSKDRSLSIRLSPSAPDGFIVFSHAGDNDLTCKDYVREKLGLRPSRKADAPVVGSSALSRARAALDAVHDDAANAERTAQALSIFDEALVTHPALTAYFQHRLVQLPEEAAGEAVRFHPRCPFGGERVLAMVCLVRDILTNEPKAIHRTALSLEGRKVTIGGNDRLSLGPVAGGAIKLTCDEHVTVALGVAEGIETALSLRSLPEFGRSPVWSLVSSGGVKALPALPGIESLWVAVDADPTGIEAAEVCAGRWSEAGREVFLVQPQQLHTDLNDIVRGEGTHA